jgi:four helix bundle protein
MLMKDRRTLGLSDQLYRALGSISANISEGYSRGTGRDRARFYEYALGSARETRDWYYKGRDVLGEAVTGHRLDLLASIIRLLLKIIPDQRGQYIRDSEEEYGSALEQTDLAQ